MRRVGGRDSLVDSHWEEVPVGGSSSLRGTRNTAGVVCRRSSYRAARAAGTPGSDDRIEAAEEADSLRDGRIGQGGDSRCHRWARHIAGRGGSRDQAGEAGRNSYRREGPGWTVE